MNFKVLIFVLSMFFTKINFCLGESLSEDESEIEKLSMDQFKFFYYGREHYFKGNYDQSIENFDQFLNISPENSRPRLLIFFCLSDIYKVRKLYLTAQAYLYEIASQFDFDDLRETAEIELRELNHIIEKKEKKNKLETK